MTETNEIPTDNKKIKHSHYSLYPEAFRPMMVPIQEEEDATVRMNIRNEFSEDEEDWEDFKNSIKEFGILQPLCVAPNPDKTNGVKYLIIFGERRWRAARELTEEGHPVRVPYVIDTPAKDADEEETKLRQFKLMALENIQRKDLTHMEKARLISTLEDNGMSVEKISDMLNKSLPWVYNYRTLAKDANEEVQQKLAEGRITQQAALDIVRNHDRESQAAALKTVLSQAKSRAATTRAAQGISGKKMNSTPPKKYVQAVVDTLREAEDLEGVMSLDDAQILLVTVMQWVQGKKADVTLKKQLNAAFDGQLNTRDMFDNRPRVKKEKVSSKLEESDKQTEENTSDSE